MRVKRPRIAQELHARTRELDRLADDRRRSRPRSAPAARPERPGPPRRGAAFSARRAGAIGAPSVVPPLALTSADCGTGVIYALLKARHAFWPPKPNEFDQGDFQPWRLARSVGDVVQIAIGIGFLEVQRRRQDPSRERSQHRDGLDRPGRAEQVPDRRFRARHRRRTAVEDVVDRARLDLVVERRRRAVRVDVADVARLEARVAPSRRASPSSRRGPARPAGSCGRRRSKRRSRPRTRRSSRRVRVRGRRAPAPARLLPRP